jgi:hypothetical protein
MADALVLCLAFPSDRMSGPRCCRKRQGVPVRSMTRLEQSQWLGYQKDNAKNSEISLAFQTLIFYVFKSSSPSQTG